MRGGSKVAQNFMPSLVLINRAAMTLVNDYQVKEVRAKLLVGVIFFVIICEALVKGKIDFVSLIDLLMLYDCKLVLKMLKVALLCLGDEIRSVGKIEYSLFAAGFPKSSGVGKWSKSALSKTSFLAEGPPQFFLYWIAKPRPLLEIATGMSSVPAYSKACRPAPSRVFFIFPHAGAPSYTHLSAVAW